MIGKKGIICFIDVHDINKRPLLEDIVRELKKLNEQAVMGFKLHV